MKSKLIYHVFSISEFIWTLLLRLLCVVALVYTLTHFGENRVVISIVAGLCILFIFFIGEDRITVYSDKIVHSTNSFASLIFRIKGRTYHISELNKAYLRTEQKSTNALELGVVVLLVAVMPKRSVSTTTNPIFLDTKTGKTFQLDTHLSHRQMKSIVDITNSLIEKNTIEL